MAEGVFLHLAEQKGLTEFYEVASAGTAGYHIGERPDSRMIDTAEGHGVVLPSLARQLDTSDFDAFDFIIAMDSDNLDNINQLKPDGQSRATIFKMRDFDDVDPNGDVPDPYYGGLKGFENVFQMLKRCNEKFIVHLESNR
ncbi:MAG: protein-tyrosine phosphatase [Bacteroidia bacterium]|jgi:protein-tyrosine phosphatase